MSIKYLIHFKDMFAYHFVHCEKYACMILVEGLHVKCDDDTANIIIHYLRDFTKLNVNNKKCW